ncbi:MerR family transcriptional regulator [Agromyces seonyuensis]|uniref:MerR family transcriptional regulator n=1 Tax=Agromyces seonyuensis TaxID=2662446 RepID=A0A6I4NZ06_9MICO|nr:MerR family transcriptional regulator [Agromyces seonyuensis]MWB97665.1 MerR family transcriptional regulator [Agromyces seonyuensis]
MAWSTRELAELAGTTVNTVRHYHQVGLLAEPERRVNGYKQYGVPDLVRLLRIRRLVDLGIPLARIAEVVDGGDRGGDALRELDAELAATIERLRRVREDIAAIRRERAPADAPAGFAESAGTMSEADRSILHIYGRLYDDEAMTDLRQMVTEDPPELRDAIDGLPADADEETRQHLAEAMVPSMVELLRTYPWLRDPTQHTARNARSVQQTLVEAVVELYNPAQLDVFARTSALALERIRRDDEADG